MITGKVTQQEATIALDVAGSTQAFQSVDAIIDTGYNGYLTLPHELVSALNLSFAGYRSGTLADGSKVILEVYIATARWHHRTVEVLALQSAATPLVGMALLNGSRLTIEARDGGDVTIEELADRNQVA